MKLQNVDKLNGAICCKCKKYYTIKNGQNNIYGIDVCSRRCFDRFESSKKNASKKNVLPLEQNVLYTKIDCTPMSKQYLKGKILVLNGSELSGEYKNRQFQLWRATGGRGCDPEIHGTSIHCTSCCDGSYATFDLSDFIGILKEELAIHVVEREL